jgi:ATP adenylyltransferase
MTNDKSHQTAITRRALSVPMRYLDEKGLLSGEVLDYGCGKGQDADALGLRKYDPYYFPDGTVRDRLYDTITCQYVLNVLHPGDETAVVLSAIRKLLKPGGAAYITVRRDVKTSGYTSKGTYQRDVDLQLPVVRELKGAFCIYLMTK